MTIKTTKEERDRLLRIISMCLSVEKKGIDPFEVKVQQVLETLRKYLPHWKSLEDFALDAETLNSISSIVRLQGNWIKHRSSVLFVDPLLIELKIKLLGPDQLLNIFRRSWHPVVEMDLLSKRRIEEAIEYWNQLLSLEERLMRLPDPTNSLALTSIDELIKSRLLTEGSFDDLLRQLWLELKMKVRENGKILYWNFIFASSYEETVFRAYMTSFLLTYGFATMEIDPIEEENFLIPYLEPKETSLKEQMVSFPISIDYDLWWKIAEEKNIG